MQTRCDAMAIARPGAAASLASCTPIMSVRAATDAEMVASPFEAAPITPCCAANAGTGVRPAAVAITRIPALNDRFGPDALQLRNAAQFTPNYKQRNINLFRDSFRSLPHRDST